MTSVQKLLSPSPQREKDVEIVDFTLNNKM